MDDNMDFGDLDEDFSDEASTFGDRIVAAREALGLATDRFTIALLGSWSEARAPADLFKGQIEAAEAYRELFRAFAAWPWRWSHAATLAWRALDAQDG